MPGRCVKPRRTQQVCSGQGIHLPETCDYTHLLVTMLTPTSCGTRVHVLLAMRPASLTDFNQTAQKTTDIALVWGAQNSQLHEIVEPLRQWTEGYNPVSMQEKSWHGYFSHEFGTSGNSMKHLGDGGGFGNGICGSGSLPVLSNIPDALIHGSSFLQPLGQLEGFKFIEETGGCGMSMYLRISNTIPAKFDFYAETTRG
jgi:hypothetical protein